MNKKCFVIMSLVAFLLLPSISLAQTANASYQFNQNLTIGSTGTDVVALQQLLINKGFLTSVSIPTGYFGSGTQSALAKFQAANGISPASGYFGSETRAFMNSLNVPAPNIAASSEGNQQSESVSSGASGSTISSSLINEVEPSIVEINCYPPDFSTSGEFDSGSGVSVKYSNYNGIIIETNYHVYNAANTGGGSPTCYAVYPQGSDFLYNPSYGDYQLTLYGSHYDPDTYEDVADFTLGAPFGTSTPLSSIPTINGTSLTGIGSGCSAADVGDNVTIFGYPASGNALQVSETVTQGTIAGIITGPIYKFDGAIDHGNSGGLAVLDKDSCDLGIPTLGVSGLTAGIGYIQSVSLIRQPVALTNDQVCQNQYGANSDDTGTKNSQGGPVCGCASGYTWNSGNTACVAESGYQVCSNAYSNETWDGTYGSDGKFNCVCDSGYVMNSTETGCVEPPNGYQYCLDNFPNSSWEGSYTAGGGYDCVCNAGYMASGGQCVSQPSCPLFSSYNSATDSCTCDAGYSLYENQCVSSYTYCTDIDGFGATYDAGTNSCACSYGYLNVGGRCESGYVYCSEAGEEFNSLTGSCYSNYIY